MKNDAGCLGVLTKFLGVWLTGIALLCFIGGIIAIFGGQRMKLYHTGLTPGEMQVDSTFYKLRKRPLSGITFLSGTIEGAPQRYRITFNEEFKAKILKTETEKRYRASELIEKGIISTLPVWYNSDYEYVKLRVDDEKPILGDKVFRQTIKGVLLMVPFLIIIIAIFIYRRRKGHHKS